jgi:hypothetical protein
VIINHLRASSTNFTNDLDVLFPVIGSTVAEKKDSIRTLSSAYLLVLATGGAGFANDVLVPVIGM